MPKIGHFKSESENVDEDILRLGEKESPHAVEIDLMMPVDEGKSPKVRKDVSEACGMHSHGMGMNYTF